MVKPGVKNEFAKNSEPEDRAELTRRARKIVSSLDVMALIRSKDGVTALMMAIGEAHERAVGGGQIPPRYAERTGEDLKLSAVEFARHYYGAAIDQRQIPNMATLNKIDPDLVRALYKFRENHKESSDAMVRRYGMPPSRRWEGDAIESKAQEGQTLTALEANRLKRRQRYRERTGQPSPS